MGDIVRLKGVAHDVQRYEALLRKLESFVLYEKISNDYYQHESAEQPDNDNFSKQVKGRI